MNKFLVCIKDIAGVVLRQARNTSNPFKDPPFYGLALTSPAIDFDRLKKVDTRSAKEIVDEFFDGFLWDVQKKRRSVEVRLRRKFGAPNWAPHGAKMLLPKTNIVTCNTCGHFHESQYICEHCYQRIKVETEAMQKTISEAQGFEPIEKDVRLRYKGEDIDDVDSVRLIELDRERPKWFSDNLLSRTGQTLPEKNLIPQEPDNKFKS